MRAILILAVSMVATEASAKCTTFGTLTTCDDGSSYTTLGNTTYGQNSRTGERWQQTTIGNTTYGTAADGGRWTKTEIGNSIFGHDSDGKSFSCFRQYNGEIICY